MTLGLKTWPTYLGSLKNLVNIFGGLRKWHDMITPVIKVNEFPPGYKFSIQQRFECSIFSSHKLDTFASNAFPPCSVLQCPRTSKYIQKSRIHLCQASQSCKREYLLGILAQITTFLPLFCRVTTTFCCVTTTFCRLLPLLWCANAVDVN